MNVVKLKYHLQRFSDIMIQDIKYIMKANSDNHAKADVLSEYLEGYGFIELGLGTNIIVYVHKDESFKVKMKGSKKKVKWYSCVYKIALDEFGLQNNWDDVELSQAIPEFAQVYEVRKDGLISVQEYCKTFNKETYVRGYIKKTMKLLDRLSQDYLLIDVSPKNLKNYGLDTKGHLRIIDGSDLIPLWDTLEIECQSYVLDKKATEKKGRPKSKKCKGDLVYDEIYHTLVCKDCGKEHNPVEFRKPWIEVDITDPKYYSTGFEDMTEEEEKEWKSNLKENMAALLESIMTLSGVDEDGNEYCLPAAEYYEMYGRPGETKKETIETVYDGDEDSEDTSTISEGMGYKKSIRLEPIARDADDDELAGYLPAPMKALEPEPEDDDDVVVISYEQLKAIFGGKDVKIEGFVRIASDDEDDEVIDEDDVPEDYDDPFNENWASMETLDESLEESEFDIDLDKIAGDGRITEPNPDSRTTEPSASTSVANICVGNGSESDEDASPSDDFPKTYHQLKASGERGSIAKPQMAESDDDDDEDEEEAYVQTSAPIRIEKPKPIGGNLSIGDDEDDDSDVARPDKKGYPAKKQKKKKKKK